MNERIKALALQAGVTGYFAAGTEYATPIPLSDEVQKFAELIVEECMWKIMQRKEEAIDNDWHVDEAMSAAISDISEHFGVEQ
jgi:hypothetical protein